VQVPVPGVVLRTIFFLFAKNPLHSALCSTAIRTNLDPAAEFAELQGRAEGEREASQQLHAAAASGDAKAALAILQHQHGWVAKQQLSIDIEQRISVTQAREDAQRRVIEGVFTDVTAPKELSNNPKFHVEPNKQKQKAA
jgi:hypothetical protein